MSDFCIEIKNHCERVMSSRDKWTCVTYTMAMRHKLEMEFLDVHNENNGLLMKLTNTISEIDTAKGALVSPI